jgi:hypothetical protein
VLGRKFDSQVYKMVIGYWWVKDGVYRFCFGNLKVNLTGQGKDQSNNFRVT